MSNQNPRWVLGIASSHNAAVCLLKGSEIVVAIQEERLLREKRAMSPACRGSLAIRYCLDSAGIGPEELSAIGVCSSISSHLASEDVTLNPILRPFEFNTPVYRVGHHMGHAVGAFATSGFQESAILVVDGNGSGEDDLTPEELTRSMRSPNCQHASYGEPKEVISLYVAEQRKITPIEKHLASQALQHKPGLTEFWSLGKIYENIAAQIFGSGLDGAGKVMGLAPYGRPIIPVDSFFSIENGVFCFKDAVPAMFLHDDRWPLRQREYQDLAASAQAALEEGLLNLVARLRNLSDSTHLCFAGGVALNSVANERIVQEGGFSDVFIMPAAEDSGTAIGAAYFALWKLTKAKRDQRKSTVRMLHDSLGRSYSDEDIQQAMDRVPGARLVTAGQDLIEATAAVLSEGRIVGWYQRGSELGPRALGQRSILCDPRHPEMKDTLNQRVKFRENFRPFAPAVLEEKISQWFEAEHGASSPFMLRVMRFHEHKRSQVPAVVHVDGTGRVQTVSRERNGLLYDLIVAFERITGVPMLLNTSFNIAGEPIIETPTDALWCFLTTGIEYCVLGGRLLRKDPEYRSPLQFSATASAVATVDSRIPGVSPATKAPRRPNFFISVHADRLQEMTGWSGCFSEVTKIYTDTPWGPVVRLTDMRIVRDILSLLDGKKTGFEVLEELRATNHPSLTTDIFTSEFVRLARIGAIQLRVGPTNNARVTDGRLNNTVESPMPNDIPTPTLS